MDVKTVVFSSKGQICIPKEMRNEVKFKEGEKLILIADKDQLIIKKMSDFLQKLKINSDSLTTMLLSEESLKKDWDNKYDERWNNC